MIEALLLHEAGAKHDPHVGPQSAEALEGFLAIHQRHAEVEQDEIEVARAGAEEIEAFETGLRGDNVVAGVAQEFAREDEEHFLVVHHHDALSLASRAVSDLAVAQAGVLRMEHDFAADAPESSTSSVVTCGGAGDAFAQHAEIFVGALVAFPDVLDQRARAGDDLEKIVQLAGDPVAGSAAAGR